MIEQGLDNMRIEHQYSPAYFSDDIAKKIEWISQIHWHGEAPDEIYDQYIDMADVCTAYYVMYEYLRYRDPASSYRFRPYLRDALKLSQEFSKAMCEARKRWHDDYYHVLAALIRFFARGNWFTGAQLATSTLLILYQLVCDGYSVSPRQSDVTVLADLAIADKVFPTRWTPEIHHIESDEDYAVKQVAKWIRSLNLGALFSNVNEISGVAFFKICAMNNIDVTYVPEEGRVVFAYDVHKRIAGILPYTRQTKYAMNYRGRLNMIDWKERDNMLNALHVKIDDEMRFRDMWDFYSRDCVETLFRICNKYDEALRSLPFE